MKKGQGFKKLLNSLRFQIVVLVAVVGLLPAAVLLRYTTIYMYHCQWRAMCLKLYHRVKL